MDYKNFLIRVAISFVFIFLYYFCMSNNIFILLFGILIYFFIFFEINKFFKKNFFVIIIYFLLSLFSFILYFFFSFKIEIFNLMIFSIIFFDTFSYIIGSFFGRNFLFKKISPKKTIEGLMGGIFFTNFIYYLLTYVSFFDHNISSFILINLFLISAFFGDLIQSFFKRRNGLKNSSNLLPGHGGFFDRFDSFLMTIIVLNFYTYIQV